MSVQLTKCNKGSQCSFHKEGKCKFVHEHVYKPNEKTPAAPVMNKRAAVSYCSQLSQISSRNSLVKDGYIDVKKPAEDAATTDLTVSLLRTAARSALGGRSIRMKLYSQNSTSSGAGTALGFSHAVTPSAASEWASIAALYDMAKCHGIKYYYATVTTGSNAGLQEYALSYDSTRNVAGVSMLDVLESPQHELGCYQVAAAYANTPSTETKGQGGYRVFNVRMVKQPVANAVAVTGGSGIIANFPGEWYETNNAATLAYSMGYIRFYGTTLGGTDVLTVKDVFEFEMEFKERT